MSPSGSRMHTAGTSTASSSFCRRASRSKASGRKTDGASGLLLARIGGIILQGLPAAATHNHFDEDITSYPLRGDEPWQRLIGKLTGTASIEQSAKTR